MKKIIIILLLILLFLAPTYAKELSGNVNISKEITSLKDKIFSNITTSINTDELPSSDPDFMENKTALKSGIKKIKDRSITVFSKGYYGVIFADGSGYYCDDKGGIINYLYEDQGNYPKKLSIYNKQGSLSQVSLITAKDSSYNYNAKGELMGFCENNECFDRFGNVSCTRYSY
ncbi:MAG: hypothetical protein WCK67_00145 [bacterium]